MVNLIFYCQPLSLTVTGRLVIAKYEISKNGPLNEKFQEGKLEKVSTRQFGSWTFLKSEGDNSKFLNGATVAYF
jgi:hypothetical protein